MGSISVVITTLDDQATLRDCVDGVLAGGSPVGEVLVVDRGSADGTLDVARRLGPLVRVIERPGWPAGRAVAAATREAAGDEVTVVPSRAILGHGAIAAGGSVRLRPVGTTAFGRAAAAVVGQAAAPAVDVGGSAAGAPPRPSWYLVADTPARLAGEAFHGRPAASQGLLVAATVALAVGGRGWLRVAVPLAHGAAAVVRAVRAGEDPGVAPHRAFLAAEIWDWAAGAGWWAARTARR